MNIIWFLILVQLPFVGGDDYDEDEETITSEANSESSTECGCETEIYEPSQEYGIIKSPNYPKFHGCVGRCVYIIKPHANKSVTLYTSQFEVSKYAYLDVFTLFYVDGEKYLVFMERIKQPSWYYYSSNENSFPSFVSARNAGFELRFQVESSNSYTSFKISFDRYNDNSEICDYPFATISKQETVIQREHEFTSASGCVYYLRSNQSEVTSEEDEFLIQIEESENNEVSMRTLDGSGKLKATAPTTAAQTFRSSDYLVHLVSHKSSKNDGSYQMARITAKLVNRGCLCDTAKFSFETPNTTQVRIASPGYPDLYCPAVDCTYETTHSADNSDTDKVALLEVRINAFLGQSDNLMISNKQQTFFRSDPYQFKSNFYKEFFVVKQQSLNIRYTSAKTYAKRYFEVNMTEILVYPECICNQYKDKQITKSAQILAYFGSNCTYLFCHYMFSSSRPRRFAMQFTLFGVEKNDIVMIKDDEHTEKFEGNMLSIPHRYETSKSFELYLFRDMKKRKSELTLLKIEYDEAETGSTCDGTQQLIPFESALHKIIVSPGYPKSYPEDQNCEYLITFPDKDFTIKMTLDEVSLEKYHDYIRFYAGNTTEGQLLNTFTGIHLSVELNFTKSPILMVFQTDRSTSDRGFHISIDNVALDHPFESPSNTMTYLAVAMSLVLLILILIGVYAYRAGYLEKLRAWKVASEDQGQAIGERRIQILDPQDHNVPVHHNVTSNNENVFD